MYETNVDRQDLKFDSLLNEDVIGNAISKYWEKAWGIFSWIGNLMSGCMGVYFSLKVIKFIVDTSIHAWALYPLYGMSWRLIGMFWDTVTYCLVHHKNAKPNDQVSTNQGRDHVTYYLFFALSLKLS